MDHYFWAEFCLSPGNLPFELAAFIRKAVSQTLFSACSWSMPKLCSQNNLRICPACCRSSSLDLYKPVWCRQIFSSCLFFQRSLPSTCKRFSSCNCQKSPGSQCSKPSHNIQSSKDVFLLLAQFFQESWLLSRSRFPKWTSFWFVLLFPLSELKRADLSLALASEQVRAYCS